MRGEGSALEENEKLRMGDESSIDLYSPISISIAKLSNDRACRLGR